MKAFYDGAFVALFLLCSACSKDQGPVVGETGTTEEANTGLAIQAKIHPWVEDESLRTLSWNIDDPTASTEALVPKIQYTQEEFNGEFAPSENLANLGTSRVDRYYIGQNRINPQYTEISIKLRRPSTNTAGTTHAGGAKQYRYTLWNGRDFRSGVQGGNGRVTVSTDADGKQTMHIFMPLAKQSNTSTNRLLFDGEWYVAITLGGSSGGWDQTEGMNQYYGPCANGTIMTLYEGTTSSALNAYRQFGTARNYTLTASSTGYYPIFTEPNRVYFPIQNEYGSYFGLSGTATPTNAEQLRKGIGLREQVGANSTMKRHFPMMSTYHLVMSSKMDANKAVGDNSNNYAEAHGIVIKPRGTMVAFKFKNSTAETITINDLIGNHGGTFYGYQASLKDGNPNYIIPDPGVRSYKAISYQGFYLTGTVKDGSNSGYTETEMLAKTPFPFVGMTTGPEEFPLISSNGTEGITLAPGETTRGRFYLWFTADQGAEFKVRFKYTVEGNSTSKLSKPQKVNPNKNHTFEEGKVYGALVEVKPE